MTSADVTASGLKNTLGTLVSITSHEVLPDGRYLINCQAGPRCSVTNETSEPVAGGQPLLRVDISLSIADDPPTTQLDAEEDATLALRCLETLEGEQS